jgi:hypothetical protein
MKPHFVAKQSAYDAVEARFRCNHSNRQLRLRVIADGRPTYYRQCVICGHAGNAVPSKAAKLEVGSDNLAPNFETELETKWFAHKHAEYIKTYAEIRPQLSAEYEEYLRSSDWAKRRPPILARSNGICEVCEHFRATDVHHVSYARIGAELDSDLLAVCTFCHGLLHSKDMA